MSRETVLVVCAHSDDQILGPGATMAKYAKDGKRIITIILSYGETSHPHLKEDVIKKLRINEANNAEKVIGGSHLQFFNLREGKFATEGKEKKILESIGKLIMKYQPTKVFTHSCDDPHPDHRATYQLLLDSANSIKFEGMILSFDVWNPFNIRKRMQPKLYVDVSDTFQEKLKALECFKSQKLVMLELTWLIYLRAILHGWIFGCKYAERFYVVN